ncbi:MAG TPA: helix-turn-helix domain-containing protein [Solirubrobacteraceae bacterium]
MRSYGDPCGIARALDLVGERWALLVVRELLLGPKRFTDLRAGLPHLGPDILSQRLRELEQSGVVRRDQLPPPAASRVYELTEWGRELEPVVLGLGRWGSRAPFPADHGALGVDALMLALKTLYDPGRADGLTGASFEVRLAGQPFDVRPTDRHLDVSRGAAPAPVAVIDADPEALQSVLWHGRKLSDARSAGAITIDGERRAAERLLRAFPLPV